MVVVADVFEWDLLDSNVLFLQDTDIDAADSDDERFATETQKMNFPHRLIQKLSELSSLFRMHDRNV